MAKKAAPLDRLPVPSLEVKPDGPLAGRTLRMRYPSTRVVILQRRGEWDDVAFYVEILDAIEEHDFGREVDSLPQSYVLLIGQAWLEALREKANPPASGGS